MDIERIILESELTRATSYDLGLTNDEMEKLSNRFRIGITPKYYGIINDSEVLINGIRGYAEVGIDSPNIDNSRKYRWEWSFPQPIPMSELEGIFKGRSDHRYVELDLLGEQYLLDAYNGNLLAPTPVERSDKF